MVTESEFQLTYPLFALALKDGTGTILLRHGDDLWCPLFTEDTNALTYARKTNLGDCLAVELPTPAKAALLLRNAPSRGRGACDITTIVIDPIDNEPRVVTLFTLPNFLAHLHRDELAKPPDDGH